MADTSTNTSAILFEDSFCDTYFDVAGILAYVSVGFLIVGLLIGLAAAIVGLFREPADKPKIAGTADAFLVALKGLIEALAAAPVWLGMFGAGILLFWIIGEVVPENCKGLVAQVAKPTEKPPEKPPAVKVETPMPGNQT